jgi:hypothetical protein
MVLGPQHLVGLGSFLPTPPLGMNLPSAGWRSSHHTDEGGRRAFRRMSLVCTPTHPIFAENGSSSASNLAGHGRRAPCLGALKLRLGAALRDQLTDITLVATLGAGVVATEAQPGVLVPATSSRALVRVSNHLPNLRRLIYQLRISPS